MEKENWNKHNNYSEFFHFTIFPCIENQLALISMESESNNSKNRLYIIDESSSWTCKIDIWSLREIWFTEKLLQKKEKIERSGRNDILHTHISMIISLQQMEFPIQQYSFHGNC